MMGDIIGLGIVLAFMLAGVTAVILILKDKVDK